jgi:putative transposase
VSRFRFIEAERARHGVALLCRVLGVSRAGFYAWRRRLPSARARADGELTRRIHQIHAASRGTYGSPRVHAKLRAAGIGCGRRRVARLMRAAGLAGCHRRRRRPRTTVAAAAAVRAPDLVQRAFRPAAPNRLWVADITYVATWEGWLYLAVVLDAFSRRVVGWAMVDHLRTELVLGALNMALRRRRPAPGLVHHSDHGVQYAALAFGRRLREAGLLASMGSVGDSYDNAVAESFFATLKAELVDRRPWPSRARARLAIFEYVECWYNRQRRHSTLNYRTPADYERTHQHPAAAVTA